MKGLLLLMIMLSTQISAMEHYPSHWWEHVDPNGQPEWEIFPQEAVAGKEVVLSKRNELGQHLSNLGHTPFVFRGKKYESVEGLWQSMKYPEGKDDPRALYPGLTWPFTREEVEQKIGWDAMDAGSAAGENMYTMGINWVSFNGVQMEYWTSEQGAHYQLIKEILRAKVHTNENVKKVLLATGDLILKSDHKMEADTPPAWRYYQIYMELRAELQEQLQKERLGAKKNH